MKVPKFWTGTQNLNRDRKSAGWDSQFDCGSQNPNDFGHESRSVPGQSRYNGNKALKNLVTWSFKFNKGPNFESTMKKGQNLTLVENFFPITL